METKILYGKPVSDEIERAMREEIAALPASPQLVIIQAGSFSESNVYIRRKKLFGERAGFKVRHKEFSESVTEGELLEEIKQCNSDTEVSGVIVQLPLPAHIDSFSVLEHIAPGKDVDGQTAANVKLLWSGRNEGHMPATARGVLALLDYYDIALEGKHAVVIGRSDLVGKPIALALLNRNTTVTIAHAHTKGLSAITRGADLIVSAAGKPGLINESHVSPGQIIIDVGITSVPDGNGGTKLSGDVNFDAIQGFVAAVSPVPGGVGPLTVASLFSNVLDAYKRLHS